MTAQSLRRFTTHLLLASASLFSVACSGSDGPGLGPEQEQEETQTASVTATPTSGTIARGESVSVTVVYTRTGGLTFKSTAVQRQYTGISITQTSTQTVGTTITRVYAISADETVPAGTHAVNFSAAIDNYTGTGVPPTPKAVFSLVVTE